MCPTVLSVQHSIADTTINKLRNDNDSDDDNEEMKEWVSSQLLSFFTSNPNGSANGWGGGGRADEGD